VRSVHGLGLWTLHRPRAEVTRCRFFDTGRSGIALFGRPTVRCSDCLFEDYCRAHGCCSRGESRVLLERCLFAHCGQRGVYAYQQCHRTCMTASCAKPRTRTGRPSTAAAARRATRSGSSSCAASSRATRGLACACAAASRWQLWARGPLQMRRTSVYQNGAPGHLTYLTSFVHRDTSCQSGRAAARHLWESAPHVISNRARRAIGPAMSGAARHTRLASLGTRTLHN
jgi:hypothetical protein